MKVVRRIADIVLVLAAICAVSGAFYAITHDLGFTTVTSRSMEPAIKAGDTLMTTLVNRNELAPTDIVVLNIPEARELRFSHRIISVETTPRGTIIETKGDANPDPDAWKLQITAEKVPRVLAVIPTAWIYRGPLDRRAIFYLTIVLGISLLGLALLRAARFRARINEKATL